MHVIRCFALGLLLGTALSFAVDLSTAVVVVPATQSPREKKALSVLVEEIEKRTQIRLVIQESLGAGGSPAIIVGQREKLRKAIGAIAKELTPSVNSPEGFTVQTAGNSVIVAGNDERGVLFGVGYLLRNLKLQRGIITAADELKIASAPALALRGHQLGYRPKVNSYDGFTVSMWDQYIRDLAIFGTNAIELIPPRSDDADDSPHFPLPKMQMMREMSRIADEYGLDVWIWYPALDEDYSDPKTVEFALNEWEEVFRRLPRIDHIFVPGGDPGRTHPKHLFALLEKQNQRLQKHHSRARIWMSPQGFNAEWMAEFYRLMEQQPAWLAGIVYGPQVRVTIPELIERLPKRYLLRRYPDITHSLHCQYPVPDWDVAYAVTEGREGINPRPIQQRAIFRAENYGIGFLTYSEGVNDDVNKFVWSGLGWNPDAGSVEILREFSRYFIGEAYTDSFAKGLMALEQNWVGPLLTNRSVDTTYQIFAEMEAKAGPQTKLNWRFQQGLYRAYYDSYVHDRLLYETALESEALEQLRRAKPVGSILAMSKAEQILNRAVNQPVARDKRQRVFELAEALYQSIRAQLSVAKYHAIAVGRGANLDTIDVPLNNRLWLMRRFAEIRKIEREDERLAQLNAIVNWTNPGPGGFYDDLGNPAAQPHLLPGLPYEKDPMFRKSPMTSFAIRGSASGSGQDFGYLDYPVSWRTHAEALFDTPVQMRYTDLDRSAQYRVRVVYGGDNVAPKMRLVADDRIEVHGWIQRPIPFKPLEFDVPLEATRDGDLLLSFYGEPNRGGSGRGSAVAEVWLMRK